MHNSVSRIIDKSGLGRDHVCLSRRRERTIQICIYWTSHQKASQDAERLARVNKRSSVQSTKVCSKALEDTRHLFEDMAHDEEEGVTPAVEDDQTHSKDAEPALTNPTVDPGKQRELVLLQAQQEGIQNIFQSLTESLDDAAKSSSEENWSRNFNATLGIIKQYQDDLKTVSREITICLNDLQMSEQFKTDFLYQEKMQEFRQDVAVQEMKSFKDNRQSESKPRCTVAILTNIPVDDRKLVKFPGTEIKKVSLRKFLKDKAAALETYSAIGKKQQRDSKTTNPLAGGSERENKCLKCYGDHRVHRCDEFHATTVEQTEKWAMDKNLYRNCLQIGHGAVKCVSKYVCRVFKKRHNTLLHFSKPVDVVSGKFRGDVTHAKQGNYNHFRPTAQPSTVAPATVPIPQVMVTLTVGGLTAATSAAQVTGTSVHPVSRPPSTHHTTGTSHSSYTDEDLHIPLQGTAMVPVLNNSEGVITCGRTLPRSGSQIIVTDKFASKDVLQRKIS